MKLFRWEDGRQGSGYRKMTLALSQKFKFDVYLLEFDAGVGVPIHMDPTVEGFEHHRINIGRFVKTIVIEGWRYRNYLFGLVSYLRPDLNRHSMMPRDKKHYMLSMGWLRKKRE